MTRLKYTGILNSEVQEVLDNLKKKYIGVVLKRAKIDIKSGDETIEVDSMTINDVGFHVNKFNSIDGVFISAIIHDEEYDIVLENCPPGFYLNLTSDKLKYLSVLDNNGDVILRNDKSPVVLKSEFNGIYRIETTWHINFTNKELINAVKEKLKEVIKFKIDLYKQRIIENRIDLNKWKSIRISKVSVTQ